MQKNSLLKSFMLMLLVLLADITSAQIQLRFAGNPSRSGRKSAVGTTYTWNNVGTTGNTTIKAVIELMDITGGASLENIDNTNTGSNNAWQPIINGSQSSGSCWGIEFNIRFYDASTSKPITLSSFNAAGVDIDGDGGTLREYNRFDSLSSYTLESNTKLTTQINNEQYTFSSPQSVENGIDYTKTRYIVRAEYQNRSEFTVKLGSCCVGGNCSGTNGNRLHSINMYDAIVFSDQQTLPVDLLYFDAQKTPSEEVNLSWATASEKNNNFFTIERSTDVLNWIEIAQIPGAGNSTTKQYYSMVDHTPGDEVVYYRLKQTDYNGDYEYFQIQVVNLGTDEGHIKPYPNPATSSISLELGTGNYRSCSIRVTGSAGRVLISKMYRENHITLDIHDLPKGMYVLTVIQEDQQIKNYRFIKE